MYRVDPKPSKPTYDWLEYSLLTVCRKVFSAAADLKAHSIEPRINRVFPHQDYLFELEGGDAHFQLILRLHHGIFSFWGGTEKIKTAKVFSVMRHVYQLGFSAPFPYTFDASHKPFGWPYLILDPGDGIRWWEGSSSLRNVQDEYTESLADELARLHTLIKPEHPLLPKIDAYNQLKQIKSRTKNIDHPVLKRCFEGCFDQLEYIAGLSPVLLHGQYDFDHVLISNGNIRNIIDWEHAALGDPRWDIANASLSLQRDGDRSLANRFLAKYVQVSGIQAEDIGFWEGLVALQRFALSIWLKSLDPKSFQSIVGLKTPLMDKENEYRKRALRQFG